MVAGNKVVLAGREEAGFGEIASGVTDKDRVEVRFFTNSVSFVSVMAPLKSVRRATVPTQSRCFRRVNGVTRYGRVLVCQTAEIPFNTYQIYFAGDATLTPLREDEFSVRSYLGADDPLEVLAALGNETPFFFEHRVALLQDSFVSTDSHTACRRFFLRGSIFCRTKCRSLIGYCVTRPFATY
jgi:hypothetical protein